MTHNRDVVTCWVDTWEVLKRAVRNRQPSLYYDTEHTFYGDVVDVTAGSPMTWPMSRRATERHSI